MLLLTSVNDILQIALSSTGPIDTHATWVDTNAGVITPSRRNLSVTTAGINTVVPAPAPSTQRNVKSLHFRNKHATDFCQVIVMHFDGANQEKLFDVVLPAQRSLQYTDQGGFRILSS